MSHHPVYEQAGLSRSARRALVAAVAAVALLLGLAAPAVAAYAQSSARAATSGHVDVCYQLPTRLSGLTGSVSGRLELPQGSDTYDESCVVIEDAVTGDKVAAVRMDSGGGYSVDGLLAGTYKVTFNRLSGVAFAAPQFFDGVGEEQGVADAAPVTVVAGQDTGGVDATLVEGGSISGALVDASGHGLEDCYLQAYTEDGSLVTRAAYSGDDGVFEIGGLSTGQYKVRVVGHAYGRGTSASRPAGCGHGTQFFPGAAGDLTTSSSTAVGVAVARGQDSHLAGSLVYLSAPRLANLTRPTVSGAAVVGSTLTATPGSWSAADTTYALQWYADGVAIDGATSSGYVLTNLELGKRVSVRVTALKDGFTSSYPAKADAVGPVVAASVPAPPASTAFVLTVNPVVGVVGGGEPRVGDKLKVGGATLSMDATQVRYHWLRNGQKIKHAKRAAYKVKARDAGKRLAVKVVYRRPGFDKIRVVIVMTDRVARADVRWTGPRWLF